MASFSIDTNATLAQKSGIDTVGTNMRRYSSRMRTANQIINEVMSGQQRAQVSSAISVAADNLLTEAARLDSLGKALMAIVQAYERGDEAAVELLRQTTKTFNVSGQSPNKASDGEVSFIDKVINKFRDIIKWIQDNILPKKTPEQIAKDQERAHDLAMQDEVFDLLKQNRFSKKTWKNASLEERKQILEDLMYEVAIVMGINAPRNFSVCKMEKDTTMGYFSYENDLIAINETYLNRKDSYDLTSVVIHEMRHNYQHQVIDHPERFTTVTEETVAQWRNNFDNYKSYNEPDPIDGHIVTYDEYVQQPIEWDAHKFAKQTSATRWKKPDYKGSWK